MRGPTIGVLAGLVIMITGCGQVPAGTPETSESPTSPVESRTAVPSPSRSTPAPTPTPEVGAATPSCPASVPDRLSLEGVQGRSFAFAELADPDDVTVEGRVSGSQAWSTSKVLVVAAFLETTADGDPDAVSAANRRLIRAALQPSDAAAVRSLRQ